MGGAAFLLSGHEAIYRFPAPSRGASDAVISSVLTVGNFVIPPDQPARQVLVEVYYDPQFYDIEVLMEAAGASETQSRRYTRDRGTDVSQFKGARKVFIEAEPGEYKIGIVAKLPPLSPSTAEFTPRYLECQLYAVAAVHIPSALIRPGSLNYFGLLGPSGKGFGQATYRLPELLLQPREYFDLYFNVSGSTADGGAPAIDVQAIESDGKGQQLDLSLRELDVEPVNATNVTGLPPGTRLVNFVAKHTAAAKTQDAWEEGVSYESLAASGLKTNGLQRIRIANRDPAEVVRAQIKVVVTERVQKGQRRS